MGGANFGCLSLFLYGAAGMCVERWKGHGILYAKQLAPAWLNGIIWIYGGGGMLVGKKQGLRGWVALATAMLLMAFPQPVRAEVRVVDVYYYALDCEGDAYFETETFEVYGGLGEAALLWIRFANLLENAELDKVPSVATGTRLLGVWLVEEVLYVDMSAEVLSYGGGVWNERMLFAQLMRNAGEVNGARWLTLLVEGTEVVWPEGSRAVCLAIDKSVL